MSLRLLFPLLFTIFGRADVGNTPERWCHRELPVTGGVFKYEPPYWQYPGCPNQPFDTNTATECMKGRTLYVMGNSVGRQNAFGLVELLGGGAVKRENQRDMCPKHETTWDDSCHQEFGGVKIRYLFIQFMDGFNYTDRGGAPFWRQRVNVTKSDGTISSEWMTGRLGKGIGNTPNEFEAGNWWADDNCIAHKTRECLGKFFKDSTPEDVFIFTLGMSYPLDTPEEEAQKEEAATGDMLGWDMRAWLTASAVNFKSHLTAVFKGKVFRVTMAAANKNGRVASLSPKLLETNRVLAQLWQTESVDPSEMWYHIDQWAINEGRDELYNDHIHFNGPLTQATLQQMLNELCPGRGNTTIPNKWPRPDLDGSILKLKDEYFLVDKEGYLRGFGLADGEAAGSIPWLVNDKAVMQLSESEVNAILRGALLPALPTECLVRGNSREVFWIKQGKRHSFPSAAVFVAHGFEWGQVLVIDQFILDLIPKGEEVSRR